MGQLAKYFEFRHDFPDVGVEILLVAMISRLSLYYTILLSWIQIASLLYSLTKLKTYCNLSKKTSSGYTVFSCIQHKLKIYRSFKCVKKQISAKLPGIAS